jgi:hypothetical protein
LADSLRTKGILDVQYPGGVHGGAITTLDTVEHFTYNSDILAVGDQCTFDVVLDAQGKTWDTLQKGATVRLYTTNPAVNMGQRTLKHLGIITDKSGSAKAGKIQVTSADLGWHLQNCHYGIWKQLRKATYRDLLDPNGPHNEPPPGPAGNQPHVFWIEPSFNFQGLRIGKGVNSLNRGLKLGRAQALSEQTNLLDPVFAIQTEPGMTPFDNMLRYAQRINLLVGTTVDGYIQAWTPDYDRPAQYNFICDPGNPASNCIDIQCHDTISTIYTDTTVVGEKLDTKFFQDNYNPNAAHVRGDFTNTGGVLPFVHRHTRGDGEMWSPKMAQKMAEWDYKRGIYDSHYLTVQVPDHYQMCQIDGQQAGVWYESDMLCTVTCPHYNLHNQIYYIASAAYESEGTKDTTTLTLRLPWFLSASFGEWPTPSLYAKEQQAKTKGEGSSS